MCFYIQMDFDVSLHLFNAYSNAFYLYQELRYIFKETKKDLPLWVLL